MPTFRMLNRILNILLLMLSLVVITSSQKSDSKETKEWFLKQTSSSLGLVFSDISKDAVRIRTSGARGKLSPITIIMKAPNWKAIIINEDTKCFTELSTEQWKRRAIFQLRTGPGDIDSSTSRSVVKKERSEMIAGFPATVYMLTMASNSAYQPYSRQSEIWVSSKIKVPTILDGFFCSTFGVPDLDGLPLRIFQNSEGGKKLLLDTLYGDYRKLDRAVFSHQLKEYKRISSIVQVILGKSFDDLEEMSNSPL